MRCGDCGAPIIGEPCELAAIRAGLTICAECIASMEAERDAYGRERTDAGEPPCDWFERQLARAEEAR